MLAVEMIQLLKTLVNCNLEDRILKQMGCWRLNQARQLGCLATEVGVTCHKSALLPVTVLR